MRIILVGHGRMGQNHERVIRTLPQIELVAIVDPVYTSIETKAGTTYASDLQSIRNLKFDSAIVASPSTKHLETALMLAQLGVSTLIEKPLATTPEDCETILNAFDQSEVKCAVGHVERFNPAVIECRKLIREGKIGQLLQISTIRQGPNPQRIVDVGVGLDLLSHDVDLTRWICKSGYDSVYSQSWKSESSSHEDSIYVVARLMNGVLVNHTVNWISPFKKRELVIVGTDGALYVDLLNNIVRIHHYDYGKASRDGSYRGESTELSIIHEEPLRIEILSFLNFVSGYESDICTLNEALEVVRVISATESSAQKRLEETIN